MKIQILVLTGAVCLFAGCAEFQHDYVGGAAYNDNDVLTGGPMAGTKVSDLPEAVKKTLQQNFPHEEVADIDRTLRDGREIYLIKFARRGTDPVVSIGNDGHLIQEIGIGRGMDDWGKPTQQNAK